MATAVDDVMRRWWTTCLVAMCLVVSFDLALPHQVHGVAHAATPAPTHFVNSAIGSDTNAGTSPALPWRSLNPVAAALAGWSGDMVVQVTGPATSAGIYKKLAPHPGSTLTIEGAVPAVTPVVQTIGGDPWTVWAPVNVGARAQIEPVSDDGLTSAVLGPAGQSAPDLSDDRFGAWSLVTLDNGYQVWRAPKVRNIPNVAAWATDRTAIPNRIPIWRGELTTNVLTWSDAALNPDNVNTRWGLFTDDTAHYLIPPPDGSFEDPNNIWFWAGYSGTLYIDGPDVTIKDLAFVVGQSHLSLTSNASRTHIVNNDFRIYAGAVGIQGSRTNQYANHVVVEQNRFSDDGNWTVPGSTPPAGQLVSWQGYKTAIAYGSAGLCSCFRNMESAAITGQGGAQDSVYQDNTVEGGVDGFDLYPIKPGGGTFDEHAGENQIIQRNLFRYLSDDALDWTGNQQNLRVLNNRAEYTGTFLSLAWSAYGPITVTDNVAWRTGAGARPGGTPLGYFFKMGAAKGANAANYVQPQVTVSHNTFWTDDPTAESINPGGGGGDAIAHLILDHNIFRQESSPGGHIVRIGNPGQITEDYNDWSEASPTAPYPFQMWNGNFDTITGWRDAGGQGLHSNLRDPSLRAVPDAFLVDPTHGDLHASQDGVLNGMGYTSSNANGANAAPDAAIF